MKLTVFLFMLFALFSLPGNCHAADVDLKQLVKLYRNSVVYINVEKTLPNGNVESFTGTGFVISKDGHILTSCHLVSLHWAEPDEENPVKFDKAAISAATGSKYGFPEQVENIRCDVEADIALLKFMNTAVVRKPIPLKPKPNIKIADPVASLGFPLDTEFFYRAGKLSGVAPGDKFLTDMTIASGDSGAPVVDRKLNVVGIVQGGYSGGLRIGVVAPLRHAIFLMATAGLDTAPMFSLLNDTEASEITADAGKVIDRRFTDIAKALTSDFNAVSDGTLVSVIYPVAFTASANKLSSVNVVAGKQYSLKSVQAKDGFEIISSRFIVTSKKDAEVVSIATTNEGAGARATAALKPDSRRAHVEGFLETLQVKK